LNYINQEGPIKWCTGQRRFTRDRSGHEAWSLKMVVRRTMSIERILEYKFEYYHDSSEEW